MSIRPVESFCVAPQRELRSGLTFRTIRGSGPEFEGKPVGEFGRFQCLRIFYRGERLFCTAKADSTGAIHEVFLYGTPYISPDGTREKPYKIKIIPQAEPQQ